MQNLQNAQKKNLPQIAQCHRQCFPDSLTTKLGKAYVQQTFDWYLDHDNRFLFYIEDAGKVVGYCGGFVPSKPGDGSSSGMLQHAFSQAIKGLLMHPWLLFNSELVPHYTFLWRNLKRKITGKVVPAKPAGGKANVFKPYCGLVVIGVHPDFRGKGFAQLLMAEFEKRAIELQQSELILSVKKNNTSAIQAYNKFGWSIKEEQPVTFVMQKKVGRMVAGG